MLFVLKVLVVSDIKRELGYVGSASERRAWNQVKTLIIYLCDCLLLCFVS